MREIRGWDEVRERKTASAMGERPVGVFSRGRMGVVNSGVSLLGNGGWWGREWVRWGAGGIEGKGEGREVEGYGKRGRGRGGTKRELGTDIS